MEETQKMEGLYLRKGKLKLANSRISLWGSILMLLSGALPFMDIFIIRIFPSIEGKLDVRGFPITSDIWLCSLYLCPFFIIVSSQLRPHILTYFFPLFSSFYTAILYFAPVIGFKIEPDWGFRILIMVLTVPLTYTIYRVRNYVKIQEFKEKIIIESLEEYIKED